MTSDAEARYNARATTAYRPDMSALAVAQLYANGLELTDDQIGQLRSHGNSAAWFAACEPAERERLLAPPAAPAKPTVTVKAGGNVRTLTSAFSRLEKILMAPTRPIFDDKGRLIGGERVLPDLSEQEPEPAPESQRATPDKPKASGDKRRPVTILSNLCKMINVTFKDLIGAHNELAARVQALEARLPLGYEGTWREGIESKLGSFYTDRGSIWYCREPTTARPGTSSAWQLACKAGRDAK